MRIVVLPVDGDQTEEELTARLVLAIAAEIWRLCGRGGNLDCLEAERMLAEMTAQARAEAAEAVFVRPPVTAPGGSSAAARTGWGSRGRAGWLQPHVAALGAE